MTAKEMAQWAYFYLECSEAPPQEGYSFTVEKFNAFCEQYRLEILQKLEEGGWINDHIVYHEFGIYLPEEGGE